MKFNMDYLKGLVNQVKAKGSEYTGVAADKAKEAARIAKLTMELNGEKEALKKAYLELGKACFEEKAMAADGVLGQLFGDVEAVKGRVEALQQELDALRKGIKGEAADFEETVAETEPEVEVEITQEPEAEEKEAQEPEE